MTIDTHKCSWKTGDSVSVRTKLNNHLAKYEITRRTLVLSDILSRGKTLLRSCQSFLLPSSYMLLSPHQEILAWINSTKSLVTWLYSTGKSSCFRTLHLDIYIKFASRELAIIIIQQWFLIHIKETETTNRSGGLGIHDTKNKKNHF